MITITGIIIKNTFHSSYAVVFCMFGNYICMVFVMAIFLQKFILGKRNGDMKMSFDTELTELYRYGPSELAANTEST